jgi:hypothetical protein
LEEPEQEDSLVVRDSNGNNVNFSDRLNKALQVAADYTGDVFLNIRTYWEKVKAIAKEEGVNEKDCQREFTYKLRGKLNKHQVYYLFHREERVADMKARQQSSSEGRKFATYGFTEADQDDTWVKISDIKTLKSLRKDPMADIQELVASIASIGLLHPIMVNKENVLIVGYRRLLACKMLRWEKIPVIVRDTTDHTEMLILEYSENEYRIHYTPEELEEMKKELEQLQYKLMGIEPPADLTTTEDTE